MDKYEIVELVSSVTEFNDLSEFMQDENLDKMLATVVKLMQKPDISPGAAAKLIAELQAFSTKCGLMAIYYTTFEPGAAKSDNAKKKTTYYKCKDMVDKLVDALKYSARSFG